MLTPFRAGRRMEDLALFTRHVAGAMNARAPLLVILRAYVRECEGGALTRAIKAVADRVEGGLEFSAALDEHPKAFPSAYRRLVRLGEQGRTLGGVMTSLADSLDQNLRTYESFRRAAVYPVVVLIVLFVTVSWNLVTVMPKFQAMFDELGFDMAGPFGSIDTMRAVLVGLNLLLLFALLFLLAISFGMRVRGFNYGRMQLQIPLIGPVLRKAETARFATYLALLLENRVPLADALGLLSDASDNSYIQATVQDFVERYQRGEPLSDLLSSQPVFPASMAAMVAVAENQGGLADTLRSLGGFYADRTTHDLAVLREFYEPVMLVLAGLIVIMVLFGTYMPLFQLPSQIGF